VPNVITNSYNKGTNILVLRLNSCRASNKGLLRIS